MKAEDAEVLVINGLQYEQHSSHLTIDEALAFIEKVKPKKAYITHISHRLGLHQQVENRLPENVFLAYDGLTLSI